VPAWWLLCPYDTGALGPVQRAERSHLPQRARGRPGELRLPRAGAGGRAVRGAAARPAHPAGRARLRPGIAGRPAGAGPAAGGRRRPRPGPRRRPGPGRGRGRHQQSAPRRRPGDAAGLARGRRAGVRGP
jgi:hypothetical protein